MSAVREWSRLDNAAKIFPPTSTKQDPKVFRFVCELNEAVDAQILQTALDRTVELFPFYRSVLKKGLFWYFFEDSPLKPTVEREWEEPCSPIYDPDKPGLLFRVTYYRRRINLEVFHALADGVGAVHFLRMLVYHYLMEKHQTCIAGELQPDDREPSLDQISQDAFHKYYDREKKIRLQKRVRAYRIRGARLPDNRAGFIEGVMPVSAVLPLAHETHSTLGEFLTALLLCAIGDSMDTRDRNCPAVIAVPVDLRHYFPTHTARNFFGLIHVSHSFRKLGDGFPDVLENVRSSFEQQLKSENMMEIINRYSALENNTFVKAIPLALKIPCLKLAGWQAGHEETAAVSNLGVVTMPPELSKYIHLFNVSIVTNRPQICMCTFGDNLTVSYTSHLKSTSLPCAFFRKLTDLNIPVEINSNLGQEEGTHEHL